MAAARASDDLPSNATALTALRIADRFTLGDTWRLIQDGYKLGLEHGVYSVSLAPYDHHRAGICYSVRGVAPDQRCAILHIDDTRWRALLAHDHADAGVGAPTRTLPLRALRWLGRLDIRPRRCLLPAPQMACMARSPVLPTHGE